jgi:murein DD-endopeptidase MepM/ murein hydrolase activator NlpD
VLGAPVLVHGFAPPAQRWSAGHRGVDLASVDGAAVRAAGAGVVGYAGLVAGVPVVTVVHGQLRTTYQPVLATVRPGQAVTAGARLGRLRLAGGHCGPTACLHWGLLRGATYLDPMTLLRRGPPVLLPLLS